MTDIEELTKCYRHRKVLLASIITVNVVLLALAALWFMLALPTVLWQMVLWIPLIWLWVRSIRNDKKIKELEIRAYQPRNGAWTDPRMRGLRQGMTAIQIYEHQPDKVDWQREGF